MSEGLVERIRASVIGRDEAVRGPFGTRRVTYADYTASGRALSFIEDFLRDAVLPLYANTHTESSGTGLQTTRFREQARGIIRRAVGATDEHAVLFCGSGATGAVDRLVGVLNLRIPRDLDERYGLSSRIPPEERPVVLVGPYEHHSNELPWRETLAEVVEVREDLHGGIDREHLEEELLRHRDRPLLIGSFSAASNVTGVVSDARAVSSLLHRHGALSFWDFAAAAPYVEIGMGTPGVGARPASREAHGEPPPHGVAPGVPDPATPAEALAYKDAIFLSPHKLIGGPGTPGVLVARRELFRNSVPHVPGGGTVWYVNPSEHRYVDDPERREEGGTPEIVGSVRAGLVFALKEAVGAETIRAREESFIRRAVDRWSEHPGIEILGPREAERLSIVSFVMRHGDGYLHHNYVVALLNDLFGIQARGGCSCAGPYGHRLLGIDLETSRAFERVIGGGCEGIKPGWVRVNFNYFISETVFEYILEAVELVASHGARLLDRYAFDRTTGLWRHRDGSPDPPMSLDDVRFTGEGMAYRRPGLHEPEGRLAHYLQEARGIVREAAGGTPPGGPGRPGGLGTARPGPAEGRGGTGSDFESLRWFPLPEEGTPGTDGG